MKLILSKLRRKIAYHTKRRIQFMGYEWLLIKLVSRSLFKTKNRLFIDCGSNTGQGYSFFKTYLPPRWYDAVLVEPNPNCMAILKRKFKRIRNLDYLEAAAWVRDERLKLFGLVEDHRGDTSDGASIIPDHNSQYYESDVQNAIEVDAFRLADYVKQKSNQYDQIIIKVDIESSEYEVLKDLVNSDATQYISHMFIEFHSMFFETAEQPQYRQLEVDLVDQLRRKGVGVTIWE